MSKAVKAVAGIVVGVGEIVAGVVTGNIALIVAGVSTTVSSVKALTAKTPSSMTDRLNATIDPRTPRKSVFGSTAFPQDIRYQEWFPASDQGYCGMIICHASHKVDGLDEIWIDTRRAWSASGGVESWCSGYFFMQHFVAEGSPSNTVQISTPDNHKWTNAHRLTGCAYSHVQFRVTGIGKKATSPFSSGIPSRMTFIGRGGMLYDPRRDSTRGGSGPMRADDQSTWAFTASDGVVIGESLPLQILRVLLGWRITNPATGAKKLAVGSGLPPKRIDFASFAVAASIADELANRSAGGTEPKFHGAAAISEGDDPATQLNMLLAGCNGRLRDVGGKIGIWIAHNDLAAAATDDGLTDDDVVGAFTWNPDPALDQTPNVVRGRYTDPSITSLYQMIDYPEVRLDSPNGIDRILTIDLAVVESASQAQRIVKQTLERKQYARSFTAPFDIVAWRYGVGDVAPLTFSPLGFVRRLFRVEEQEVGPANQCVMTLSEENAAIYAWDADDVAPVQAATPIIYDPTLSPIVQAIGDTDTSALQAAIANSFPVGLTISASDAGNVTISNHIRRYTDGHVDVAITGTTLTGTGLVAGDFRAIAYDDLARAGGAVPYALYSDDIDARTSPSHPGRHYVGYVFIPTAGSPPSDGGGATPPGGHCVVEDTPLLIGPGEERVAGDFAVGDVVYTRHEVGFGWGLYPVEAIEIVDSDDVWEATIGGRALRATGDHLVYVGSWTKLRDLSGASHLTGTWRVVKLTVTSAHTYVSSGILSHNLKSISTE